MPPPFKTITAAILAVAACAAHWGLTLTGWVLPALVGGLVAAGNIKGRRSGADTLAATLVYGTVILLLSVLPLCLYALYRYH